MPQAWDTEELERLYELQENLNEGIELEDLAEEYGNLFSWQFTTHSSIWNDEEERISTEQNRIFDLLEKSEEVEETAGTSYARPAAKALIGVSTFGGASYNLSKDVNALNVAVFGVSIWWAKFLLEHSNNQRKVIKSARKYRNQADNFMERMDNEGKLDYTVVTPGPDQLDRELDAALSNPVSFEVYGPAGFSEPRIHFEYDVEEIEEY